MRILQIVNKPQRRGAELFAIHLGAALRYKGNDVLTVFLYDGPSSQEMSLAESTVLLGGREDSRQESLPSIHVGLMRSLMVVTDEFGPDIVQVGGGRTAKYGAMMGHMMPRHGWHLVYRNIGDAQAWIQNRSTYHFYRWIVMPQVDGVISVTESSRQSILGLYDLSVPVVRIPTGISPKSLKIMTDRAALRRQHGTPSSVPLVLFVGNLSAEKRVDRLIRVVAGMRRIVPELHLWIVGDGPLQQPLQTLVMELGVGNWVHFCGTQSEIGSYMNAADLFMLASDTEGIPRVVLEAGYMGLPVVASNVGGINEFVSEGVTGHLLHPENEQGMTVAGVRLLQNPDTARQMGDSAHELVNSHYTISAIADQYLDFYNQLYALPHSSRRVQRRHHHSLVL